MKRQLMLAAALLLVPSALLAQEGRRGGGGFRPQNVARLIIDNAAEVELTEEQLPKLEELAQKIDVRNDSTMEAMRASGAQPGPQGMARMRELRQKQREEVLAELKTLLTADQFTKAEAVIERNRPQRRGGGGGGATTHI
jgi:hypothetical protein